MRLSVELAKWDTRQLSKKRSREVTYSNEVHSVKDIAAR